MFYIKEKNNNKNNNSVIKVENDMKLIECLEIIKEAKKDVKELVSLIDESLEFYKGDEDDYFYHYDDETEYFLDVSKYENGFDIMYGEYFGIETEIEVTGDIINSEILSAALLTDEINDSHVVENEDLNVLIYNSAKHDGLVRKGCYFIKGNKLTKEDLNLDDEIMEILKANPNNVLIVQTEYYTEV